MKEKLYYVKQQLNTGTLVTIEGEEFHHMINVMRARVNDNICLFNGDGIFYHAIVKSINKKYAEVLVNSKEKSLNQPIINISVYQALAKGDKLSLIMQKITEIGASSLCLFESKFCDVKSNTHKPERLENISISAAKQCGRASLVDIKGIYSIKEIAEQIKDYDAFFVAYENEDGHTLSESILSSNKELKNIAIMIGAEGGFSDKEINLLKENGADIVSLGKRILRTETAAIATTAIICSLLDK